MFKIRSHNPGDGRLARQLASAQHRRKRRLRERYAHSPFAEFGPDQMVREILVSFRATLSEPVELPDHIKHLVAALVAASSIYHETNPLSAPRNTADRIREARQLDEQEALLDDCSFALDLVIETINQVLATLPSTRTTTKSGAAGAIVFDIGNIDCFASSARLVINVVERIRHANAASLERGYALFSEFLVAIELQVKKIAGLSETADWPKGKNWPGELEKQLARSRGTEGTLNTYLAKTPLSVLFDGRTDIRVTQSERMEHMHILAPSGAGKTRTLEHLITQDLSAVSKGKASVLVMESEGGLIGRLARHAYCDPQHPKSVHSRITLIDPGQPGSMPTFSLFGIVGSNLRRASDIERETITNSVTDLYRYVFRALRGGELTERQGYIFNKLIQMLIWVDGSSFETLLTCLKDTDEAARLSSSAPSSMWGFFSSEYPLKTYLHTRTELYQRLDTFRSSAETLNRMLSGVVSNYDLEKDLKGGRLILINTNKEVLGEEGSQIMGRFIVALIRLLSFRRNEQSPPLFLYLDEAYEYIDEKVTALFRQGRKRQIGIIVAHQELAQLDMISADTRHAIQTNTQIKLTGNSDYRDRAEMARNMGGTSPEFFTTLRKKHLDYSEFALFIRNQTPMHALKTRIPLGTLEKLGFVDRLPPRRWPVDEFVKPNRELESDERAAELRSRSKWIDPWAE